MITKVWMALSIISFALVRAVVAQDGAATAQNVLDRLRDGRSWRDSDGFQELVKKLGPARADGVPILVQALRTDTDPTIRAWSALLLAEFGSEGRSAIAALTVALKDPDARVRRNSAWAVTEIDASVAIPAVSVLTDVVKTGSDGAARSARALGAIGPAARSAIPVLLQELKARESVIVDVDSDIQLSIAGALEQLGESGKGMRFLIAGATDPNGKRRILAVKTLACIGQAAAPAKPSVLAALKDELGLVRVYAATALGKLGEIDVAVSELVAILPTSTFPPDRVAAAEGVRQIGQKAKAAGEALVQVLIKDEDKSVRAAAADALGAFGSEGTFAVRPLSDASKDQDVAVRYFAARSLKKIQP